MKLVMILIALGIEHYLITNSLLHRFDWFTEYSKWLHKMIKPSSLWQSWLGVITLNLPLVVIVGIVLGISTLFFHSIFYYILSVGILVYCFGPEDFYKPLQAYLASSEIETISESFLKNKRVNSTEGYRQITKAILSEANHRILIVLFWFIIAGPLGALIYRLATLIRALANQTEFSMLLPGAVMWQQILDWVPLRLIALIYSLVGNFAECFNCWLGDFKTGLSANDTLTERCGLCAIGADIDAKKVGIEENREAFALVERVTIVMLVVVALFTLGACLA